MSKPSKEAVKRAVQKRREKLFALGLCVSCGKAPAVGAATLCEECREKSRQKSREYYRKHRTESGKFQPPATLCWDCKNAVPTLDRKCGCSWSRWFRPVEGWEAVRKDVRVISGGTQERMSESYIVKKCPQFVKG